MAELPKIKEQITDEIDALDIENNVCIELHKILFDKEFPRRKLRIKNVRFKSCLFSQNEIKNIVFLGCSFAFCQFNGARISDCEFHQCKFDECCFYKAEIEKTYLDPSSFNTVLSGIESGQTLTLGGIKRCFRTQKKCSKKISQWKQTNVFYFTAGMSTCLEKRNTRIDFLVGYFTI